MVVLQFLLTTDSEIKGERVKIELKAKNEIELKTCKILIPGRLRVKLFRLEHSSYDETHLE